MRKHSFPPRISDFQSIANCKSLSVLSQQILNLSASPLLILRFLSWCSVSHPLGDPFVQSIDTAAPTWLLVCFKPPLILLQCRQDEMETKLQAPRHAWHVCGFEQFPHVCKCECVQQISQTSSVCSRMALMLVETMTKLDSWSLLVAVERHCSLEGFEKLNVGTRADLELRTVSLGPH